MIIEKKIFVLLPVLLAASGILGGYNIHQANASSHLLNLNFESSSVRPTANPQFDALNATLSTGQTGDIPIQYEGGTFSDRSARIISDPTTSGNNIFHSWLKNATIPTGFGGDYAYKGRIQLNFYGTDYTSVFARYRMYLHPNLNIYKSYPEGNTWFTISEFWFRNAEGKNFRIPLNLGKEQGSGKPLYFVVSGDVSKSDSSGKDGTWSSMWGTANTSFEVPIGEWVDIEIGYKQGNKDSGRFYLAAKRKSDSKMSTIFDITDWTYNPSASAPTPLTGWNPLKLYTSGKVIKYITGNGGVAQIYWDDFIMWNEWQISSLISDTTQPSSTGGEGTSSSGGTTTTTGGTTSTSGTTSAPPSVSGLTNAQVQAILSLLSSFGADDATVTNIRSILSGTSAPTAAPSSAPSGGTGFSFTHTLYQGLRSTEVTKLQQFLAKDRSLYPEGLITGYYGALTVRAIQRFQAKYGIISSGSPATTGYGLVGHKTRAKLNALEMGG